MHSIKNASRGKMFVSAALTLGLAFSAVPTMAIAEESKTQSIDQITDEISRLYIEAEQTQYDLISTNNRLAKISELMDKLDVEIDQAAQELELEKANLSEFVSEDYKQGGVSLLDIIMNSSSFEDFLSQITYANKISEHKQSTIAKINELYTTLTQKKSELEQAKADQERYLAEQQEQAAIAEAANNEAVSFIEALPEEVVVQLESADAAQREEAMAASMAALENMDQAQLEAFVNAVEGSGAVSGDAGASGDAGVSGDAGASADAGGDTSGTTGGTSTTTSGTTSSTSYSDLLSRAYSLLGSGYQWSGYNYTGDSSSSSFTCSGVVDYALGRSSQSSSPESLYEEVGSNLTTDVSSLQEGDLVFYSYGGREVGHVGIYAGNGQVIDSIPNGGVAVRDVDYMDIVGGGSL